MPTGTTQNQSVVPLAQVANDLTWPFSATLSKHLATLIATSPVVSGSYMAVSTYDPAGISQQVVGLTATQTLTNKTLTSPTINGGTTKATVPITVASTAASGTTTFNLTTSNVQNFTFSGSSASDSVTFAISGATTNQIFAVSVTQNSGGSGTVTWWGTIRWNGGGVTPILTTTAGARDTFVFICTGSGTYDGFTAGLNI